MGRLDDRVIIVTGGAQGIGRAFVLGLAREGAKIAIADVNGPEAEKTAAEVGEAGGEAMVVLTDVSSEDATQDMARAVLDRFGKIDGLINNAAFFQRPQITHGPIEELSVEEWDKVMGVNLRGPFLTSKAVVPHMKERGYGKIVNIGSGTVFSGRTTTHYVASKGGVLAFTKVLAREVGDWNITVNAIAPGATASDPEQDIARYQGRVPDRSVKRVETPEDVVGAAVFLMSGESDFVSGQTLVVDGGAVMH